MYEPLYSIYQCPENEIEDVISFIDGYWKKGHALVKSRALMDWQYFNRETKKYNFIIARSKTTNEIHSIEGFIPTTQFDSTIKCAMTWGAIWKSIPNVAPPGLGVVVKQYREREFCTKYNCEIGISPDANRYNIQSGNTIFALTNWYFVNPYIENYKLMVSSNYYADSHDYHSGDVISDVLRLDEWNSLQNELEIPDYKSGGYYLNRYFLHPFYKYRALKLESKCSNETEIVFYRVVQHGDRSCIFIVDYIGEGKLLSQSNEAFLNLVMRYNSEYILFPCYGLKEEFLIKAGFMDGAKTNDIVPLYYEPFVKSNVYINCATQEQDIKWRSFKGDADQDRPNLL